MPDNLEADFDRAESLWQLEKLYLDLAKVKGKGLTPLEKKILQGLLCGYSPSEIAEKIYQNRNSTSVRVYLSNSLYRYIQELLIRQNQPETRIGHWSSITNLLERAGYQKVPSIVETNSEKARQSVIAEESIDPTFYRNFEEKIAIDNFVGRDAELEKLTNWIVKQNCCAIALCGITGIGKSGLAVKLITTVQDKFKYIFWRSIGQTPQLESFLTDLIACFQLRIELPKTLDGKISLLLDLFRSHRCLLILDRFDRLFAAGEIAGTYRLDCQDWGFFLECLLAEESNSCCLIVSRQQPQEFTFSNREKVRSFYLSGLSTTEAVRLSNQQPLIGSDSEKESFVNYCANIPLIIQHISLTIIKIFNSNLTEFFHSNTFLLSSFLEVLDGQFRCLTDTEKKILYALVINNKLFQEGKFGKEFNYNIPRHLQIEAIESLQRRSLLLQNTRQLAYEPLLRIYIVEKLTREIEIAINNPDLGAIVRYLLSE
jgi:hypothetical protein